MKIAISGKGGVGKTTLSALLALHFVKNGQRVIAIDADPDANLALTLGYPSPEKIKPLVEMKDLIAERTGTIPGKRTPFFVMNPKVDDIPDRCAVDHLGIIVMRMGGIKPGGTGCACPENTFLKALVDHLVLERDEVVILDMEAGIEHLTRGTARGVDVLLVVAEATKVSIETVWRIKKIAGELQISNIAVIGNKINGDDDSDYLKKNLKGFDFLGLIQYNNSLRKRNLPEIFKESVALQNAIEGIVANIKNG